MAHQMESEKGERPGCFMFFAGFVFRFMAFMSLALTVLLIVKPPLELWTIVGGILCATFFWEMAEAIHEASHE